MEIFKVSTLEETQGRATKEKHDGATATDMEKDGLFLKNIHCVPEKVSNGSVERPKTNTSYKTKALIYFTFFAFFCLKKYYNRLSGDGICNQLAAWVQTSPPSLLL